MPFHPDGPGFDGPGYADHSWWAGGGWHIVPLLMFVIFIGVVVWAVLRLTSAKTSLGSPTVDPHRADGALEEVRVRYARGEMSREEFVQRFQDLGGTGIDAAPIVTTPTGSAPVAPTEPTPPA